MNSVCDKLFGATLFILTLISAPCAAFPEMIRLGYQSCKSCHYDSSGGGPLTAYGRTISEEKLSMSARPKEGEAFYGYVGLNPFGVAGDFRYLIHRYEDDSVRLTQRFPMQREVSLTFDPADTVSFVGSMGYYGYEPTEPEYRRYYGKVTLKGLGLRAGRFLPAFGVILPDHTKATRKELFSEGSETLNAEISYTGRYFELFATRVLGSQSGISTGSTPRVVQRDDRDGVAFKASLFPARGVQIGSSYARFDLEDGSSRIFQSAHLFLGVEKAWLWAEVQKHPDGLYRGYGTLGTEFTRGLWAKMEFDYSGANPEPLEVFGTVQLFPRPHFELSGSVSKKQAIFISHWYI